MIIKKQHKKTKCPRGHLEEIGGGKKRWSCREGNCKYAKWNGIAEAPHHGYYCISVYKTKCHS